MMRLIIASFLIGLIKDVLSIENRIDCLNEIKAVFSKNDTLFIFSEEKYFKITNLTFIDGPMPNLRFRSSKIYSIGPNVLKIFNELIDLDFYNGWYLGFKNKDNKFLLIAYQISVRNDEVKESFEFEIREPLLANFKSMMIMDKLLYIYIHEDEKILLQPYIIYLTDTDFFLIKSEHPTTFNYNFLFDKVAHLTFTKQKSKIKSSKIENSFPFIFIQNRDLWFYQTKVIDDENSPKIFFELNRLTNCSLTLCEAKHIDGFWYIKNEDSDNLDNADNFALVINNWYFTVPDVIGNIINGSSTVHPLINPNKIKYAYICRLVFTLSKKNYCLKNKSELYRANYEFENKNFELIKLNEEDEEFKRIIYYFRNIEELPISVFDLDNDLVILFKESYLFKEQRNPYSSLFLEYDDNNKILNAFYDPNSRIYLFIGSEYSFIYSYDTLDDDKLQFKGSINHLNHPLYGNCLTISDSDLNLNMFIIFSVGIGFLIVIVIIIVIYHNLQMRISTLESNSSEIKSSISGSDSSKFKSDSSKFESDSSKFKSDSSKFESDSSKFKSDSSKFESELSNMSHYRKKSLRTVRKYLDKYKK